MSEYPNEQELRREHTHKSLDSGCPMCGGAMEFDPGSGLLNCPFCGHQMQVEADPSEVAEQDFYAATHHEGFHWGDNAKQILCRSCGAESIYDSLQTSAVCPFCGSTHVLEEAVDESMPPNGVCPFAVTRQQAEINFGRWLRKKWFAPRKAKKSAKAENFTGMYIPYWTFDAQTYTQYEARYSKTSTDSKGKVQTTWYNTSGNWSMFIDDAQVPGTTRHEKKSLTQIEPYDTHAAVPYRPEFLAGFLSERYSIGLNDAWEHGKKKMEDIIKAAIAKDVKEDYRASSVRVTKVSIAFDGLTYKYMLLPLWKSSFDYSSKRFEFMVNGQTGKVGGKTPVSALRVSIAILLIIGLVILAMIFGKSDDNDYYDDYYYYNNAPSAMILLESGETISSSQQAFDDFAVVASPISVRAP